MKKTRIFILLLLVMGTLSAQNYRNNIGIDFTGADYVYSPKYNLPGNSKNLFISNSYGHVAGLFYERFLKNPSYSIQSGIYYVKQFTETSGPGGVIYSVDIPVEFNGDLLGKEMKTRLFLGYTGGLGFHFVGGHSGRGASLFYTRQEGPSSYEVYPKKHFFIAPYAGIHTGVNFWNMCFSFRLFYDFLIPKFVTFKTTYQNSQGTTVTEYNTNGSYGFSFRFGLSYKF